MRQRPRRGPGRRLALTLAALASLIAGYYLGQAWQRRPLADLSAVLYPNGRTIGFPDGIRLPDDDTDDGSWRLFIVADTHEATCQELRRRYAFVINRLAHRPELQDRLRLTVLAYDRPEEAAITDFRAGTPWIEIIVAETRDLDALSAQLGILPDGPGWCDPVQTNAALVSPTATAWALIPQGQAAIMARDIATIIDFVE